ncbi:MAG: hypothetical protein JRJ03_00450 [Deltaproteobacteria bacterium]|nr:hypothetical protein [Deltaproteobacteria bacterium]
MIGLRKILHSIEVGLEVLQEKTKEMERMVDTIEKALTAEAPKPREEKKPARKSRSRKRPSPSKETATDAVLNVILSSKEGVTTEQIRKKTGFDNRKIWGIVNRAKKQGKIRSAGKGRYVPV